MEKKISIKGKEIDTLLCKDNVYVPLSEYLESVNENELLRLTLRDVLKRGVSTEARKLAGLTFDLPGDAPTLSP
jgi:hypothetical protein